MRTWDSVHRLMFLLRMDPQGISLFPSISQVVLHFMVGSPSAAVSQDLAQLLSQAGLMKR